MRNGAMNMKESKNQYMEGRGEGKGEMCNYITTSKIKEKRFWCVLNVVQFYVHF